jgi:cyclopropane fatty-acyl-phospholipid synthase-like methyltransferase
MFEYEKTLKGGEPDPVKTKTTPDLTPSPIVEKVKNFYDAGSSHYVKIFGANIHDGYNATGKESREEAQAELIRFLAEKAGIENGIRILDVGCGVGGSSI